MAEVFPASRVYGCCNPSTFLSSPLPCLLTFQPSPRLRTSIAPSASCVAGAKRIPSGRNRSSQCQLTLIRELLDYLDRQSSSNRADIATYAWLLQACETLKALSEGKRVHAHIVRTGLQQEVFLENCLICMYGKCGSVQDAWRVFIGMQKRNVVSWNAMISAYVQHGHYKDAFLLFRKMRLESVLPNKVTYLAILNACANNPTSLAEGKSIHACILESALESDVALETSIINMYGKSGSVEDARRMFDKMHKRNVVSWTVMITAYAEHSHFKEAIQLFWQMQLEGILPNKITFVAVPNACANPAAVADGRVIHARIVESGFESDVVVGTSIVHMYAKCGSLVNAVMMFDKMQQRTVVSCTAMMAAYTQHGRSEEALRLFRQMQVEGVMPNKFTYATVLDACANRALLAEGKLLHAQAIENGLHLDVVVGNAIVNMYRKCGSLEDARMMFDKIQYRSTASWNAMIAAYAQHGHAKEAFQLFQQMQAEGVAPDNITFVSILSACSHAGLVNEGFHYFSSLTKDYGITPTMEHYGCMIDLLGRVGRLDDAEDFIIKMPFLPSAVVWRILLGACRVHGDVERGKRAAEHVLELDSQSSGAYVLLSKIYAGAGRWDDLEKSEEKCHGFVKKMPGQSLIEVNNETCEFAVRDRSQCHTKKQMKYMLS